MLIYDCYSKDGTQAMVCLNDDCVSVGRLHEGPFDFVLSEPDTIDLGKRLLEHFDVLPGKEEIENMIAGLRMFRELFGLFPQKQSEIDATIAKLRRLVGEDG